MAARKLALGVGGVAVFGAGVGAAILFAPAPAAKRGGAAGGLASEEQRKAVFEGKAPIYDAHVHKTETAWGVGIDAMRRRLAARCLGDTVEVCAGSGRNLDAFRFAPPPPDGAAGTPAALFSGVRSLTLVDFSPAMLAEAGKRVAAVPAAQAAQQRGALRLVEGDAHSLPLPDACADTVIDTFGLCSLRDPAAALREWGRVLRPGGQLLLLEHGRSHTPVAGRLVDAFLDKFAPAHEREWGCAWNRDIDALVAQAAAAGPVSGGTLQVQTTATRHLGTTYEVVLRKVPAPAAAPAAKA